MNVNSRQIGRERPSNKFRPGLDVLDLFVEQLLKRPPLGIRDAVQLPSSSMPSSSSSKSNKMVRPRTMCVTVGRNVRTFADFWVPGPFSVKEPCRGPFGERTTGAPVNPSACKCRFPAGVPAGNGHSTQWRPEIDSETISNTHPAHGRSAGRVAATEKLVGLSRTRRKELRRSQ